MIKMGKHYQKILRRGAKSRSGGGVTQVTVGKLLSTAAMVDTGIVHIAVVNGCWLAITILPQQTLPLPRNGVMREMMGNCQNILRSAARKKSGGNVTKIIAGFPPSIIVHLEMDAPIAVAGML